MPKDKIGNQLTWKEFFQRWKLGIEGITPIQRLKTQARGTEIQIIGVLIGLVISLMNLKLLWWVGIILFGALITILVQYLGLCQQIKLLKELEEQSEEISLDELERREE